MKQRVFTFEQSAGKNRNNIDLNINCSGMDEINESD